MPQIELRLHSKKRSPEDVTVTVQDKTYDYLMSSPAPEIRISAYLDQDLARVGADYVEVFVHEDCPYISQITKIIPGSKTRKGITLPGPMKEGEQLVILVSRTAS